MQEIKKRRIVIASVLKPVNDTRMFEKIGQSLAKYYEVHIFGFPTTETIHSSGLTLHAHPKFARLSIRRLLTPWILMIQILKLKPQYFIVATHELLLQACLLKLFCGCRIYYDIQENYYLNIMSTDAFPKIMRVPIALYVRLKEVICSPFINHFILAEQCYQSELSFAKDKSTVLENKAVLPTGYAGRDNGTGRRKLEKFIFTGTLSRTTGVYEAIDLVTSLHAVDERITLTIAGHCSRSGEWDELKQVIESKSFIKVSGGTQLIPHSEILSLINSGDVGILSYQPTPATKDRIPTKLFEYMALGLPILTNCHFSWTKMIDQHKAGVLYDPSAIHPAVLLKKLSENDFYAGIPRNVLWQDEAQTLLSLFD